MSVAHPVRCLLAKSATPSPSCGRRAFHSSRSLCARRKPAFPSLKASKLGLVPKVTADDFPPYSAAEKVALAKRYTAAQIVAIEAGEAAIDPDDLASQATIREDPMGLEYIDDLSEIHPVVDKPVRAPESNYDPNLRLKDKDELAKDLTNWIMSLPKDPQKLEKLDWMKFSDNLRLTVGKEEAERNPRSSLAPELPKIDGLKSRSGEKDGNEEIDPGTRRLMLQTGYSARQIRKFRIKQLVVRRVNNQTRLGRVQSTYFLMVAGNGRGLLGIGEGKSTEPDEAKKQAALAAVRNLRPVPRYEERTIYGDVKGKVGGTELTLMTRHPGMSFPGAVL